MFTVALSVGVISWADFLFTYYMAGCFMYCIAALLNYFSISSILFSKVADEVFTAEH
jgi:hypothetical protein